MLVKINITPIRNYYLCLHTLKLIFSTPKNNFPRKGLKTWKIRCKDEWKLISEDMNTGQQWNINYIILTYRNIIPKGTSSSRQHSSTFIFLLIQHINILSSFPSKTSLIKSTLNWILDTNLNFSNLYIFATWCRWSLNLFLNVKGLWHQAAKI